MKIIIKYKIKKYFIFIITINLFITFHEVKILITNVITVTNNHITRLKINKYMKNKLILIRIKLKIWIM